jgi:hypothetical protein
VEEAHTIILLCKDLEMKVLVDIKDLLLNNIMEVVLIMKLSRNLPRINGDLRPAQAPNRHNKTLSLHHHKITTLLIIN